MAKNAGSGGGRAPEESSSGKGVVDLADARVRLRSSARTTANPNLLEELEEVQFPAGPGSIRRSENATRFAHHGGAEKSFDTRARTLRLINGARNAGPVSRFAGRGSDVRNTGVTGQT